MTAMWQRWTNPPTRAVAFSSVYCISCLTELGPPRRNAHDVKLSPSKARGRRCVICGVVA